MSDISVWLEGAGLGQYIETFSAHDIEFDLLPELTEDHLKELGVSLGHRVKILKAISKLSRQLLDETVPATGTGRVPVESEAERRQITVMFVDLVGSTALSERFDPEDLSEIIHSYQAACSEVIARYEGYVAKYLGDGILVYFGYPQAHEDDAERALRAGLDVIDAVTESKAIPGLTLQTRIGVATGLVVVGETIGVGAAQEQSAVGETPNLAARLQAIAKPNSMVAAPQTRRLAGDGLAYEDLGQHRLKGISEPVQAWQVVGNRIVESRFEARNATPTPLIGRDGEFELLKDRWRQASSGDGQVVLLSGEPGIGKSRLVRALHEHTAAKTGARLHYQCSPYHRNSALYPVITQLRRAAGFDRNDNFGQKHAKLEALLSGAPPDTQELYAALLSLPVTDRYPVLNLTPQRQKERTLATLVDNLITLSTNGPVLFILEDAHWADPTSLELVELAVGRIQQSTVLIIVTFRPEFTPTWAGHSHTTTLALNRLGRKQSSALIDELTGDKRLPSEVFDRIMSKTDGVPLFVEELVKTILESGLLRESGNSYELDGPLPPLAVPSTLHDSLLARLDRLAPIKEIAQIAAVIGREFSYHLLAAIAPQSNSELQAGLQQLVESGLIFGRGRPPEATYIFKHALVQHAAYESLLRSKSQALHTKIAQALERHFPEIVATEPERLARHYTEAGLTDRAIPYWQMAGERAAQRSANREAIRHLKDGLELLDSLPATEEKGYQELELLATLGPALVATEGMGSPEVGEAYTRAKALCQKNGSTAHWMAALQGLRLFHMISGDFLMAQEISEEMLRLAERDDNPANSIEACKGLGAVSILTGNLSGGLRLLERGIALGRSERLANQKVRFSTDASVDCLFYKGLALWILGYPEKALASNDQAMAAARKSSHPYTLVDTLLWRATHFFMCRDPRATLEQLEAMSSLAEQHGFPNHLVYARTRRVWALAKLHGHDADIDELRSGMSTSLAMGQLMGRPFYFAMLAELQADQGAFSDGLQSAEEGLNVVAETHECHWEPDLHRLKGELLAAQSERNYRAAEESFYESLDIARRQGAKSWELRAAIGLARLRNLQGRNSEAFELLDPIYRWFTEGFATADLRDARALLDQLAR